MKIIRISLVMLFICLLLIGCKFKDDTSLKLSDVISDDKMQTYLWTMAAQSWFLMNNGMLTGEIDSIEGEEIINEVKTLFSITDDEFSRVTESYNEAGTMHTLTWDTGEIANFILVEVLEEDGTSSGEYDMAMELVFTDGSRFDGDIFTILQYSTKNGDYVQLTLDKEKGLLVSASSTSTIGEEIIYDGVLIDFLVRLADDSGKVFNVS